MKSKGKQWLAGLLTLAMCLSMLPASALAATTTEGDTVTELGSGDYTVTLKNDCNAAVKYSVTLGDSAAQEVTLDANETLPLKGDEGTTYSVTWLEGADSEYDYTAPEEKTVDGTFGSMTTTGYYYTNSENGGECTNDVANTISRDGYTIATEGNVYYDVASLITFRRDHGIKYTYVNVDNEGESYSSSGMDFSDSGAYNKVYNVYSTYDHTRAVDGEMGSTSYMFMYKTVELRTVSVEGDTEVTFTAQATPADSGDSETEVYTITLKNDCVAPVKYKVTIGANTQTVTLDANGTFTLEGEEGTSYSVTWLEGTDSKYAYVAPDPKTYSGAFGPTEATVYYLDGQKYTGEVGTTVSYGTYSANADFPYALDTLETFTRSSGEWGIGYVYTNINDSSETYSSTSDSDARDNIAKNQRYVGFHQQIVSDNDNNWHYVWMYKALEPRTDTVTGITELTITTTAVLSGTTGSFKVAALNVDGMPQSVKIANVYDLKLNEDGPGAAGSTSIGAYIQGSGIDILALSEDFNFYNEINEAAGSYHTMTQRASIPESVGLGSLNNSLFPFDTDGLNLMYKDGLTVSGESMTAWDEHYSPTTNYVVIDVPDKNGADGMIDKGFRFYQVQVADGVVVDVYILHMDAETDPGDNAARESQINQLMEAVAANDNGNPIIIMGDTNCRYTRDPLEEKIINEGGFSDPWIDLERDGIFPKMGDNALMVDKEGYQKGEVVDKVFYRNVEGSPLQITASDYFVDAEGYTDEGGLLGDHPPVIVTFDYTLTSSSETHTHDWAQGWTYDGSGHWHECLNPDCDITMNSQKDGYAAHTFTEEITTPATCTETGVKTLTCSVCGYTKTETIPNTGHKWDEGVVTTEPTATTDGVKTYTCTVCHATYTEAVPATGVAARNYTFEVKLDKTAYNVGDTVTADIYVSSEDEGANFGTVGFKLNIPAGLTFDEITSALTGGSISTNGGNYAYNVNSANSVAVNANGVKIATATFTVNSFNGDTSTAALDLSNCEVTEIDQATGASSTHSGATANLYNLKVTLNPGDNATINGADAAVTLYAKYNESGLYSDVNRTTEVESIDLQANEGYRLADTQWTNNMADFDAIAGQAFTASQSYTAQTVKTWTVTFAASNVTFADGTQLTVTVDDGATFGSVTKPGYTVNPHYTFVGWYNGDTQMADGTVINGDLTVTATAVAATFDFAETSDNAAVNVTGGLTEDSKATYGTDITFTVTPDSSYVISDVSYTVGEGTAAQPLNPDEDGVYTIPGSAITGNIAVEVNVTEYYTITFVAGTGVTMDTATAYVKAGEAALYTSTSFVTPFTVPTPAPQEGYRLAHDTAMEPLWSSGTFGYQNSAVGENAYFHRDTTLTAQAVKQWTVTFAPGTNGAFAAGADTTLTVDVGTVLTEAQIPAVTANTGYTFTGWSSEVTTPITHDVTFTAQYAKATYTLTLPSVNGISFEVSGATLNSDGKTYTVTYDTDVTITMTATGTNVTGVSYTIGGGQPVTVEKFNQPFTIPGSSITGAINLNVQSQSTYQITVNVEGGNGTVNGHESATLTFAYGTSAEDVDKAFHIVANPGYTFTAPEFEDVTDNATYTVTFTHASYEVTGVTGTTSATHGTALDITPTLSGQLLLGVQYKVGDGRYVTLSANEDGKYIIPGDVITGPISVQYNTVTGSLEYITAVDYAAAPAGKKIAVLNTTKLAEGTYALNGYGDMFWSSKYNAYVCFVDNDETDADLIEKLEVGTNSVTEISYTGDINGSGSVTPADSAAINAVLHGVNVQYTISDMMRFQFDVTGDRTVTAQDIKWVLDEYTGFNTAG